MKTDSESAAAQSALPLPESVETVSVVTTGASASDLKKLHKLATDAITAGKTALRRYVSLVEFAREREFQPGELTATLLEAGFAKSRASEIKRLSCCPVEVFNLWKSGVIGMKPALQRARECEAGDTTGEPGAAVKPRKRRKSETARFREACNVFFGEWIPIAGDMPDFLVGVKIKINNAWLSINAERVSPEGETES